ncbi:MAG TPA: TolC family protein [Phnomibacter sp.]|nr:TolC family protein [Phnomibacter sp.]
MMKHLRTLAWSLALLASATAHAQSDSTPKLHHLSALQAAEMALQQRTEVLSAQIDVKNQDAVNKEVTGTAYPQIKGNMGLSKNFKIPVTILPDFISPSVYGVLEKEDVRDGNGNPITWSGEINTFPAAFGVPWQASLGVSIQQLLFQPDVFIGLKARETAMDLYRNQLKVIEDTVKSNVLQTYYGVLISERGLQFTKESRDRLTQLYKDQEQLFKNGFIEKLDLDKTRVNLNNVNTSVTRLNNMVSLSYSALKFALGIPQQDSLHLTDSLSMEQLRRDVFGYEQDFNYENRNEIKTFNTRNKLLELQIRRYKIGAYPTVAAFWNMQTSAQRQRFSFFDTGDRWFFSNVAGVNVSVPLTDGWQRRNKVKQAEYALEKSNLTINQFKQVIDLQIVSSRTSFTNSLDALNAQIENKDLAERVFATTKTKYERGLGSSFELLQSETSLQEALANYYQAMYNAVVAKLNYLRALGRL